MPLPSFTHWLEDHQPEIPDAGRLALLIAQAGKAGVSRDDLARVLSTSLETLENLLRALVTARQVRVMLVNGQWVYRAGL